MSTDTPFTFPYPSHASRAELERFVRGIHARNEDFVDGDLTHRLKKFSTYVLSDVPMLDIDPEEFEVHRPRAESYAERLRRGEQAPPIVFDAEDGSIIDGLHRVNGAVQAGGLSILGYVGLRENRDPAWNAE